MDPVRLPKRFEFVRELGRGGMGAVYEAIDTVRGAHVAIKTLPSHDPVAIARFKREFRALADLHHPNLVSLGELFCEGGEWAFSMDLIQGTDLIDHLRSPPGGPRAVAQSDGPTGSMPAIVLADAGGARPSFRPSPLDSAARFTADESKIREAFAQLAAGLAALHAADKVHRDIKPSNIRVRDDGHVFLVDFGLVTEGGAGTALTVQQGALGTPAYMAPEQAAGTGVGAPADWYSVGVVLFEALTGRLPFEGTLVQMIVAKQTRVAPRAREFAKDVPADLEALCVELLERDPSRRPSADAVLSTLKPLAVHVPAARAHEVSASNVPPFVGRAEQLDLLARAFARVCSGEASQVVLEGESGAGKSYLSKRFLERVLRAHPKTMVVAGRCYENEAVPYNAWDGAIESLATEWMRLEPADAAALRPLHIGPLVQTFPALRRVHAISRKVEVSAALDPREVRSRAFTALRELFSRAAQQGPLIVFLDDLQWADHDSVSLLGEVLREPSPPPFLFLATVRPLRDYPDVERELRDALPRTAERCRVSHLPHEHATELARNLLSRDAPDLISEAESIAKEADGHALFITELVRHAASSGRAPREKLSLADALYSRVTELSPAGQSLLTVLSLAGRPLPEAIALRAASMDPGEEGRALAALRIGHLTRATRIEGVDWLETYHDRVRAAVVDRMSARDRAEVFRQMALTLEASAHADANVLTDFFRLAGDAQKAGRYARLAGEKACEALAFDRGAELYAVALQAPALSAHERQELLVVLADTLAKAGRGKDAAEAYERALPGAATERESNELEQKACEQLMRAGYYDAGIVILRRVFARLGLYWPPTTLHAVVRAIFLRLFLALRGRRFRARSESAIPQPELDRIDAYSNLAKWLQAAEAIRTLGFVLDQTRRALRAGDPGRLAVALGGESFIAAVMAGQLSPRAFRRLEAQFAQMKMLAATVARPYEVAYCDLAAGVTLAMVSRARDGLAAMDRAEAALRTQCSGKTSETAVLTTWACRAHFCLGEYARLSARQPLALQEANDRRDLLGATNMRNGFANFAFLVRDDVAGAHHALDLVREECAARTFSAEHQWALLARLNAAFYAGDTRSAVAELESKWPALVRSRLRLMIPAVRFESSEYRARTHLARALTASAAKSAELAQATKWAADVRRARIAYAVPMATFLHAQIAYASGEHERAIVLLREALPGLVAIELLGYAAVARRALGKLVKGDQGAALVREGEDSLRAETVKNIPALCRCLAPGFTELE